MTARKNVAFDPESTASWVKFLDRKVSSGVREHVGDARAAMDPIAEQFRSDRNLEWIHFAAALRAGAARGLSEEGFRALVWAARGSSLLQYVAPRRKGHLSLEEVRQGEEFSRDPAAVVALAEEHDLGDLARNLLDLRDRPPARDLAIPTPWKEKIRWIDDFVLRNRGLLRTLEFYCTVEDLSPTRAALGLLYVLKHEAPMWPFGKRRGKPPSERLTSYFVLEKYLIPRMATPALALKHWAPGLDEAGRERYLAAAKRALGLADWGSPRRVLLELLGAAGKEWVRPLLVEKAGYKNLELNRFLVSASVSKSRNLKTAQAEDRIEYAGLVSLLHGGVLGFVLSGEHTAQEAPGAVTSIWVRGPRGYARQTRRRRPN